MIRIHSERSAGLNQNKPDRVGLIFIKFLSNEKQKVFRIGSETYIEIPQIRSDGIPIRNFRQGSNS